MKIERFFLSQKVVRFKRSKICEEIQHIVWESKLVLNYEGGDITLQKKLSRRHSKVYLLK